MHRRIQRWTAGVAVHAVVLLLASQSHAATPVAQQTLASGTEQTCAIGGGGSVQCWGANDYGQLGTGGTTPSAVPVRVAGLDSASSIATGSSSLRGELGHVCAVRLGTVQCWGANSYGQLGRGTSYPSVLPTPSDVSGLSGVTAVSVGVTTSCAVTADGAAYCWGRNEVGQLGNGTTADSSSPFAVQGITDATAVSTGSGMHVRSLRVERFAAGVGTRPVS